MISYLEKIKQISNRLLKEGKVDVVIGFRKGTVPMMNEPYFARTEQDIHNLVWDSNCGINLAKVAASYTAYFAQKKCVRS